MKIIDVKVTVWKWDNIPPTQYTKDFKSLDSRSTNMALVQILTDENITGYAFMGHSMATQSYNAQLIIEKYKPGLVGKDPLDRERIWQNLSKWAMGGTMLQIAAIDIALWDIAGKAANMPIHKLMGSYRNQVPAYASSAILASKEDYIDEALSLKERGWTAYKIHPPAEPKLDIEICKAVREAVGDDYRLMFDACWAYNYNDAIYVGQAVQEMGFYWYEDPLPCDDIYGYVRLKKTVSVPIAATELPTTGPKAYAPWIMNQATDYLRGDVAIKGGITSCLKTAHTAETFHMNYEVHHGGNSLNNAANLHLIMAIKNCEYFEVLLPDAAQKHGIINDIEVDSNGMVHAPNGPGLGMEIDFDLINKNKDYDL